MSDAPSTEHLFWARELVRLSREQAVKKGVPDQVMAHAMLVQAFMLFTGQSEADAAKAVKGLYATSIARRAKIEPGSPEQSGISADKLSA